MEHQDIVEEVTSIYDPKKEYKWEPTDEFNINGTEFSVLYNGVMLFINSPISLRSMQMLQECAAVMSNLLRTNVENGKIVERAKEEPSPEPMQEDTIHTMD